MIKELLPQRSEYYRNNVRKAMLERCLSDSREGMLRPVALLESEVQIDFCEAIKRCYSEFDPNQTEALLSCLQYLRLAISAKEDQL